jgi:transposase
MARRIYSREFKVSAVALVNEQGYTVAQAAKNLGVDPSSLRGWLKKFPPTDGQNTSTGPGAAHAELRQLREQVRQLTMERDILKKATAFFAKESP